MFSRSTRNFLYSVVVVFAGVGAAVVIVKIMRSLADHCGHLALAHLPSCLSPSTDS